MTKKDHDQKHKTVNFSYLINQMEMGVAYQNKIGEIYFANPAAERILGISSDQMYGMTSLNKNWAGIHEDGSDYPGETHPSMVALATGQKVLNQVIGVWNPDKNKHIWLRISAYPEFEGDNPMPERVCSTFTDITDLIESKKEINWYQINAGQNLEIIREQEKYRFMFENNPQPMVIFDSETLAFLEVNQAAVECYGYSREEFHNMTLLDIRPPDDIPQLIKDLEISLKKINPGIMTRHRKKNGQLIHVEIASQPVMYKGRQARHVLLRDITRQFEIHRALQESEQNFRTFFNNIHDFLFILDNQGNIFEVNDTVVKRLGFSREDLVGKSVLRVHPDERGEEAQEIIGEMMAGRKDYCPVPLITRSGSLIDVETYISHGTWNGKPALLGISKDVSMLRLSERKFYAAFNSSPVIMGLSDLETGQYVEVNQACCDKLGFTRPEIIDRKSTELLKLDPETREKIREEMNRSGFIRNVPVVVENKKGEKIHLLLYADIIEVNGKKMNYTTAVDITERILSEQKLAESETRFKNLFDNIPDAIFIADIETGKIIKANKTASILMKIPVEQLTGMHQSQLHPPGENEITGESFARHIEELNKGNSLHRIEGNILRSDGVKVPVEILGSIVNIQDKQCIMGNFRDITERRHNEEIIRKNEERFKVLVKNSTDIILVINAEGIQQYVSPAVEKITGFSVDEVTGIHISDLIHPSDLENVMKAWVAAAGDPENVYSVVYRHKHKTKKWVYLEAVGQSFLSDPSINAMVGSVRDISYRKQTEILQQIQYNVANAVVHSRSISELLGTIQYELQQLLSHHRAYIALLDEKSNRLYQAVPSVHPGNGDTWSLENSMAGKIITEGRSMFLSRAEMEELKISNGNQLVDEPVEKWMGTPLIIDGKVLGAMIIECDEPDSDMGMYSRDILEIVANQVSVFIDKLRDEEALIQAKEKAEESDNLKTEFLNNLSHEIRTPLNGISGFTALMNEPEATPEDRDYYSRIVLRNVNQLITIIDDIISIATIEAGQEKVNEQPCDIHRLIVELATHYQKNISGQVILNYKFTLGNAQGQIMTDAPKLRQVISNLLGNAVKFTDQGAIQILCTLHEKDLHFTVSDTGIGIRPEFQEIIFERFRQARLESSRLYGGTGLGLAISKAYVELLGGKIWVESVPGKGSRFHFTIPYNPVEPVETVTGPEKAVKKPTNESAEKTIMVVEDEWSNYMLVNLILTQVGFKVIHTGTGLDAIDEFRKNPDIDLVLMDLKMPVMSGFDAARVIKSERSTLPIIAITAYAQIKDRERALEAGCDDYLAKPITREALLNLINKYL